MIEMQSVKKVYRSGLIALEALSDLTLTVDRGEFVAIMGPSGSGKTTFLNIAGLLDELRRRRYMLDGEDVRAARDNARSRSCATARSASCSRAST